MTVKNYTFPFDVWEEIQRITRAYCEINGLPLPRPRTPDSPCYTCGTGEPLQECSGCRAARIAEQRADRDRT